MVIHTLICITHHYAPSLHFTSMYSNITWHQITCILFYNLLLHSPLMLANLMVSYMYILLIRAMIKDSYSGLKKWTVKKLHHPLSNRTLMETNWCIVRIKCPRQIALMPTSKSWVYNNQDYKGRRLWIESDHCHFELYRSYIRQGEAYTKVYFCLEACFQLVAGRWRETLIAKFLRSPCQQRRGNYHISTF